MICLSNIMISLKFKTIDLLASGVDGDSGGSHACICNLQFAIQANVVVDGIPGPFTQLIDWQTWQLCVAPVFMQETDRG